MFSTKHKFLIIVLFGICTVSEEHEGRCRRVPQGSSHLFGILWITVSCTLFSSAVQVQNGTVCGISGKITCLL